MLAGMLPGCWLRYCLETLFLRNTPVIQVGVALGSCAKAQGLLLADIAVGLFLMPSPLALSPRERG